jgi:hypothetical protein
MEYPSIPEAERNLGDWNGDYPAPEGTVVTFTCSDEHSQAFSDGFRTHTARCQPPCGRWHTSFTDDTACVTKLFRMTDFFLLDPCRLSTLGDAIDVPSEVT